MNNYFGPFGNTIKTEIMFTCLYLPLIDDFLITDSTLMNKFFLKSCLHTSKVSEFNF